MSETVELKDRLAKAGQGDNQVFGEIVEEYRVRLKRMVQLRLDRRVQRRVDSSDILQEAMLEAFRRLPEYLDDPKMPFGLWLRFITCQKVLQTHRKHMAVKARDVGREIALDGNGGLQVTSAVLAARLVGANTSPSVGAIKEEMKSRLQRTLDEMDDVDREIIALRHFEQLSLAEAAIVLGLKHSAACNRYVRALERLKTRFGDIL